MSTVRIDKPTADVAVITLDRAEQLNALTFELVDDLHAALDDVDRDNACRVVILTGAGRGFCSGLDLKSIGPSSMSTGLSGARAGMRSQEHIANLVPHLRRIQQSVIAASNGAAYGGGLALACACDIRIAAASARMCVQFIKDGIGGADNGNTSSPPPPRRHASSAARARTTSSSPHARSRRRRPNGSVSSAASYPTARLSTRPSRSP